MKLRIELDDAAPEEIIIRTSRVDERIKRIQDAVLGALRGGEIAVRRGEEECYIPYREVLYFETENGRIRAHTANESFFCPWDSIHNNALIGSRFTVLEDIVKYGEVYDNEFLTESDNPYFVNPTVGDYRLRDGVDFFSIPFEKMGRY